MPTRDAASLVPSRPFRSTPIGEFSAAPWGRSVDSTTTAAHRKRHLHPGPFSSHLLSLRESEGVRGLI